MSAYAELAHARRQLAAFHASHTNPWDVATVDEYQELRRRVMDSLRDVTTEARYDETEEQ